MSLFDKGVRIIEQDFGIKVLGIVSYRPFNLGFEDSASLMNYQQDLQKSIIKVAVVKLPHISNFTDFEPLVADKEIELTFISTPQEAQSADLLILPGSKRVFDDLAWLRARGFEQIISSKKQKIVAICGGYEMLFEELDDSAGVESEGVTLKGFSRFKGRVTFQTNKVVTKGCYNLFGTMCAGYEIHNGITKKRAKSKKNLYGTFVHGLFESDALRYKIFSEINPCYSGYDFKEYKAQSIDSFATHIKEHIDLDYILKQLHDTH